MDMTKEGLLRDNPSLSEGLAEVISRAYRACKQYNAEKKMIYPDDIPYVVASKTEILTQELGINNSVEKIILARTIKKYNCSENRINGTIHLSKFKGNYEIKYICGLLRGLK